MRSAPPTLKVQARERLTTTGNAALTSISIFALGLRRYFSQAQAQLTPSQPSRRDLSDTNDDHGRSELLQNEPENQEPTRGLWSPLYFGLSQKERLNQLNSVRSLGTRLATVHNNSNSISLGLRHMCTGQSVEWCLQLNFDSVSLGFLVCNMSLSRLVPTKRPRRITRA